MLDHWLMVNKTEIIKNPPELLMPVGNLEMAMAAIHNGADAVYLGFPFFNARGRSKDFSFEELTEIVQFCRLYGVKVNIALNIVIFENEFEKLIDILSQVLLLRPDSFIVQDLGLANLIRQVAPWQTLHASTQMTISNADAIKFLEDLNFKRIVLARENTISEIKTIRSQTEKELEVFVHGALCVSYSGQCFTSESLGGRSANRGQCAQSCRFAYDMYVDGQKYKEISEEYLVSPQDLCGLEQIPELMDIGVDTFKIEGRLKSPEYVASVARSYKEIMSNYGGLGTIKSHSNSNAEVSEYDLQNKWDSKKIDLLKKQMQTVYSRGFFPGWLKGVDHQNLVDGTFSAHRGLLIGTIQDFKNDKMILKLNSDIQMTKEFDLQSGDGLLWVQSTQTNVDRQNEMGGAIFDVNKLASDKYALGFSNSLKWHPRWLGSKVFLNYKNDLVKSLNQSFNNKEMLKKIPVQFSVELAVNQPLKIKISDQINSVVVQSETNLEAAKNQCITQGLLQQELLSLGGTAFCSDLKNIHFNFINSNDSIPNSNPSGYEKSGKEKYFLPHSQIKSLRRQLVSELSKIRMSGGRTDRDLQISGMDSLKSELSQYFNYFKNSEKNILTNELNSHKTLLNVLLRDKKQVQDFVEYFSNNSLKNLVGSVILDFEFGRDYADSVQLLKSKNWTVGLATTRILKPQEYNNLKYLVSLKPDLILARNLGSIWYLKQTLKYSGKISGDFSLNITNHLSASYLLNKFRHSKKTEMVPSENINPLYSLCLSYDMNLEQIQDLLQASMVYANQLEITVHQYMPSFHMEHCVFAAFLSQGHSFRDCGKPCEKHQVELKDQFGHFHQIKPDQECRNTMYHAIPQSAAKYLTDWQKLGLGFVRFEALKESGSELTSKIENYLKLIQGQVSSDQLYKNIQVLEKYGLSEGSLNRNKEYISRKKT